MLQHLGWPNQPADRRGSVSVSFETDIKPLFREKDRSRMEWAFDLWDLQGVKDNAEGILERLQDGDMPCDGSWPQDRIDLFRNWIQEGMAP
jgi:hypothetical protein